VDTKFFVAFLFLSLSVYGIDANLNFPLARPIMQVMWILVLALSLKLYLSSKTEVDTSKVKIPAKLVVLVLIIGAMPLTTIAYKTNLSLRGQQVLLGEYNRGELKYPLNQIDEVVPNIPNISVTTLPIVAMKGRYYAQAGKTKKAIEMFHQGIKVNPYLGFSENLIAQEYKKMNQLDSALKYSRIAYNKLPIPPHFTNYLIQAIRVKDTVEINRMFTKDSADYNRDVWKNYLVAMNSLSPVGNPKYIHIAKRGMELYPDQNDFRVLHKTLSYGKTRVDQALAISQNANQLFTQGLYLEAAQEFKRSSELDPLEFSYYENVGASYFSARQYEQALPYFKKVVEELNPKSGKSEYLWAISLVNLNRRDEACGLLEQSKALGYKDAATAQKNFCSNNQ
jgi:tetratricopeptide (TPR) repeat protein